ncbi:MAG: ATP-binding protein, partial [Deltaproteobacteria bacterium]
ALEKLEREPLSRVAPLFLNAEWLAASLGLTDVERAVLEFVLLADCAPVLARALALCEGKTSVEEIVTAAIRLDLAAVRETLWPSGKLARLRLVRRLTREERFLDSALGLAPTSGLASLLLRPYADKGEMLSNFLTRAPASGLALSAFEHAGPVVQTIARLVRGALDARATGVNVLLHGIPGTGKSALVGAIAAHLGVPLYAVNARGDDGEPLDRQHRLGAYVLSQNLLGAGEPSLLVFDEIEDVFDPPVLQLRNYSEPSGRDKAWTNAALEGNAVPTIWISNRKDDLDLAFLRRFQLVVELVAPPVSVRRALLDRALGDAPVSEAVRQRFATDGRLTPAAIEQGKRVMCLAGGDDPAERERTLVQALESHVDLMPRPTTVSAPCVATDYDLAYVNANHDPQALIESLREDSRASLCLSGPPGTGKSALAVHIAASLGFELVARRASDLLGPHAGETEQHVAAVFRAARRPRTLLFLDEADTFLGQRIHARARWEVSLVNELLVQMEQHTGLFVCATNLVEALDDAAVRRFSVVLKLEPLRVEQRRAMFEATLLGLGLDAGATDAATIARVERLDGLAAGDFAGAVRQLRVVRGRVTAEGVAELLRDRLEARRGGAARRVGFGG